MTEVGRMTGPIRDARRAVFLDLNGMLVTPILVGYPREPFRCRGLRGVVTAPSITGHGARIAPSFRRGDV